MYNKNAYLKQNNESFYILLLMGSRVRILHCVLSKPRLPILSGERI